MTNKNCLNCDKALTDQFCSGCGQKADTHRISFKNFIFHDVLHGTFHIDKGMLFTAKEAIIRPGQAALDYISGKRKRYYNVFYLILIIVGMMLFFRHFQKEMVVSQGRKLVENPPKLNEASKKLAAILSHSKFIIFLFVPFGALNSFLLFRRKKLNLSEHSIIAGMILLGMLMLSTVANLLFYIDLILPFSNAVANTISLATITLTFIYIAYAYYKAFGTDYSKLGTSYRIVLFFVLIFFEIVLLLFILIGIVTSGKFGEVTIISPFA